MRKKQTFLVSVFIMLCASIWCQESGVKGLVSDKTTGDLLVGASIIVGDQAGISDLDGAFSFMLEAGNHTLNISYVGYTEIDTSITVREGQYTELNLSLVFSPSILQTATVTSSKYEKSLAEAPVSINVIKPELVANTNTVRISSLLDKIPGVQIIDNQANIRGGSGWSYGAGSRVMLLIDDVPAFQADAGRPNWGDIPVENISQIEVIKGASSTLYGSAALNGIINIRTGYATSEPVTKANIGYKYFMNPRDPKKKWWTSAPSMWNVSLVHKQKFGKLDLVANGFYENFDSFYENSYDEKVRFSANLKYRVNDRISLAMNTMLNVGQAADYFLWQNGSDGIYRGLDGTFSERNNQRFYADPQITIYDKKQNRHKVFGRFYYINNDNNNNQSNSSNSVYGEYQFSRNFSKMDLKLTTGAVAYLTNSDSELFGDVVLRHNNMASYFELDKKLFDRLNVTAGMRLEYNEQLSPEVFGSDTIPDGKVSEAQVVSRFGLNYKLTEGTFLRSSWGQGYRFPTIVERFIETAVGAFFVFPNVDLESERGWSAEFGIKQGIKLGSWEGFLDFAAFWSQYSNMTEFSLQEDNGRFGFQSQNVGETDIKGLELNWVGRSKLFDIPLNILAGYTYIDPRYRNFEDNVAVQNSISVPIGEEEKRNVLKYRNQHNFKIDIEAFFGEFSTGFAYNYTSATVTIDQLLGNLGQIRLYRIANPGGFRKMDARMAYNFGWVKCSLLMENILNEELNFRPGLLEAPRNIAMRLDFDI